MIWLWIAAALVLGGCFLYINNNLITCTRYEILTNKANGRIVHLSDLHSCRFTARVLKKVQRVNPELIIITGDLWDRQKRDMERMMRFAEALCEVAPVVYVPGNHEFHEEQHEQYFSQLGEKGIHVLRHRSREFGSLKVLGLDMLKYGAFTECEFQRMNRDDAFHVIAAHFPDYFESSYAQSHADLVLCGHAHGGQFRIPFLKKGIYSPGQGIFPKYSEGIHEKNGVKMIVSRGIGNSRFPFRLFNLPEIVIVDIKRTQHE